MRCFMIKVNQNRCPGDIGTPTAATEWEGREFTPRLPTKSRNCERLGERETANPEVDDGLYIWVNDGRGSRGVVPGGRGLTASAQVAACSTADGQLRIRVKNVKLLWDRPDQKPWIDGPYLSQHERDSGTVFSDLRVERGGTLRFLKRNWVSEIDAAVRDRTDTGGQKVEPPTR